MASKKFNLLSLLPNFIRILTIIGLSISVNLLSEQISQNYGFIYYLWLYKYCTFTIYLTVILSYLNFYYYYLIKLSTKLMEQSTLNFIYFLAIIGGIAFAVFLAKLLWTLIKIILPSKNFIERYGENSWVIVTGGSDGIGLGFC